MDTVEQMVASLKQQVAGIREEFDLAVAFHSVWKPSAYDENLLRRMGPSFASNAFLVVRAALQREMLLALMRLWDTNRDAVSLLKVRNLIEDKRVIEALSIEVASRMAPSLGIECDITPWLRGQVEATIAGRSREAIALIDMYHSDEELKLALANLRFLRDKVLAHRQRKESPIPDRTATSEQIERIMADMSKLIALLCGIAYSTVYEPRETGEVYDLYAKMFWADAKGERTEGHPNYRALPPS